MTKLWMSVRNVAKYLDEKKGVGAILFEDGQLKQRDWVSGLGQHFSM